jgi:predicted lactoylglutathione lyase
MAQAIHSNHRFAHHYPELHREWIEKSEYVISLSVKNEEQLKDLYDKLKWHGAHVVAFYEPDIDNQMTSICYYGTPEMRKHTQKLDLALSEVEVATNN